jgi:tyrosyl-tRNA synthetase
LAPHERKLQKALAEDITTRVHSADDLKSAIEATQILFNGSIEDLGRLEESLFLDIFDGVPQFDIEKQKLAEGIGVIDLLAEHAQVFPSKGEARKMIQGGGVMVNKTKVADIQQIVSNEHLINGRYLLAQKGKKNYYLIRAV